MTHDNKLGHAFGERVTNAEKKWKKCAKLHQKRRQEKEINLLKLYENQKSRAFESVGCDRKKSSMASGLSVGAGKVRYLFQSRRRTDQSQHGVPIIGRDKSYPLKPLEKHPPSAENICRSNTFTGRVSDRTLPQIALHERSFSSDRFKSIQNQKNLGFNVEKNIENQCLKLERTNFVGIQGNQSLGFGTSICDVRDIRDAQETRQSDGCHLDRHQSPLYDKETRTLPNNLVIHRPLLQKMEKKSQTFTNPKFVNKKSMQAGTSARNERTEPLTKPTLKKMASTNFLMQKIKKPSPAVLLVNPSAPHLKKESKVLEVKSRKEVPHLAHFKQDFVSKSLDNACCSTTTSVPASDASFADLIDCRFCKRSFATERIHKHEAICQSIKKSKRKPFDALQQRIGGTEAEKYLKKSSKAKRNTSEESKKPNNDWRKKHEEFIRNIRAAKEMTIHLKNGGKLSDLPPMPVSDYSDYVQCPHCSRKFNEAAAERHIPKCSNLSSNKFKLKPFKM